MMMIIDSLVTFNLNGKHVSKPKGTVRGADVYGSAGCGGCGPILTGAAETLLSQANQHVQTQVTVGWLVEVLQSPHVLPVIFHILRIK